METTLEIRLNTPTDIIHQRPSQEGVKVSFSGIQSFGRKSMRDMDLQASSDYSTFMSNLECWNAENILSPISNVENGYFKEIINMGYRAVPYIYKELKKGPTDLVYALDEIYGNPISKNGFMPLEKSCELWISILQKIEQGL